MKKCNCCHKELPLTSFCKCKRTKDGLSRFCRKCKSEKNKVYTHSEKGKERAKAWARNRQVPIVPVGTTKNCSKCHQDLPLDAFSKKNTGLYGVHSICKACRAIQEMARRRTPEGNAQIKAWRKTDSAKESRRRCNKTPNAIAATKRYHQSKKYRDLVKERRKTPEYKAYVKVLHQKANYKAAIKRFFQSPRGRAWTKAWRQTDKGKASSARGGARWRYNLKNAFSTLTGEEWAEIKRRFKNKCVYCGEEKPLTMDHVIPLSKGGYHTKNNVVPACRSCNSAKRDRPVLLQLLAQAEVIS